MQLVWPNNFSALWRGDSWTFFFHLGRNSFHLTTLRVPCARKKEATIGRKRNVPSLHFPVKLSPHFLAPLDLRFTRAERARDAVDDATRAADCCSFFSLSSLSLSLTSWIALVKIKNIANGHLTVPPPADCSQSRFVSRVGKKGKKRELRMKRFFYFQSWSPKRKPLWLFTFQQWRGIR